MAVRFVARAWREAWAALVPAGVAIGAFLQSAGGAAGPEWVSAWLGVALVAMLVATGALYRSALGYAGTGPGGLQWGRVETRLLAVWLLTAAFLFILVLLIFIALLCCTYAFASAGAGFVAADPSTWAPAVDSRGHWLLGVAGLAGAAGLLWAKLRLSLASAATVAHGRVQVLSAWPMTRKMAAPILAAFMLVSLAPIALLAVLIFLNRSLAEGPSVVSGAINLVQGLTVVGLWLPMNAGLMAYLYRRWEMTLTSTPR